MATLITETASPVKLKPGSLLFTVYDRQYWLPEYYKDVLKEQGPPFREFVLGDFNYKYNESTGIITFNGDFGEVRIEYQEPLNLSNYCVMPNTTVNNKAKKY